MNRIIALIIIFSLLLSACKGNLFTAPSGSMEETIMTGESFYVEKTDHFEKNDIVVFNYYGEDYTKRNEQTGKYELNWQKWFKTLTAISNDSVQLKNGEVFVNGKFVPDPPLALNEYYILSRVEIDDLPVREHWEPRVWERKGDTLLYATLLTREKAKDYGSRKPAIIDVKKRILEYNPGDTSVINPCSGCRWTVDNFGPLKIPGTGDTIIIDRSNIKLYQQVPGIQMGKNVIKEKLYFVLGDNRHASMDSRHIGFISHSKMYGVVK